MDPNLDPRVLQEFMDFIRRNTSGLTGLQGELPPSVQDATATWNRIKDAKWSGMQGLTGMPDQSVEGLAANAAKNNFTDWLTQAPNKALQGMRENVGPLMGPDMGSRINASAGMGDLAARAAVMALSTGPTEDPLTAYARFLMNKQSTPNASLRL